MYAVPISPTLADADAADSSSPAASTMCTTGRPDASADLVGHQVHGVGEDPDQLGPAVPQATRLGGVPAPELVPVPRLLQRGDLGELHRAQHEVGRVQPTEPLADADVEGAVVVGAWTPTKCRR